MTPLIPMRRALEDPDLFGRILSGDSWRGWRVLLIAAMGEPPQKRLVRHAKRSKPSSAKSLLRGGRQSR